MTALTMNCAISTMRICEDDPTYMNDSSGIVSIQATLGEDRPP